MGWKESQLHGYRSENAMKHVTQMGLDAATETGARYGRLKLRLQPRR
jgi:hypothetical protein